MSKLNNNTGSIERRVRHILCAIVTLMKKQLRLIKQSDLQPLNPLLSHSCRPAQDSGVFIEITTHVNSVVWLAAANLKTRMAISCHLFVAGEDHLEVQAHTTWEKARSRRPLPFKTQPRFQNP